MAPRLALAAVAFALAAPGAWAQSRSVPIREQVLSDGVRRYGVVIEVNGKPVEAALDTGSLGLRVLAAPGDAPPPGRRESYAFSGGVVLKGAAAPAPAAIGGLSGAVMIHVATGIGCIAARPDCAAAGASIDRFGLMNDGLPGEGFRAILGLGMAGKGEDNLLRALGVKRWIVSLPRPGGHEPGRLILDPDEAESAGFVMLPLVERLDWRKDGSHDSIDGCLTAPGGKPQVCGPVLLDTGAANAAVINAPGDPIAWNAGAGLRFGSLPVFDLTAAGVRIGAGANPDLPRPLIMAGAAPYRAFDVLYDPGRHTIGLRPRSNANR